MQSGRPMGPSGTTPPGQDFGTDKVPPAVEAQLLATEHWSLLATRSTAQSEVLTRISILLTLVSASVVSLALVGQATEFSGRFRGFALALLGFVLVAGTLTLIRVHNASEEDMALVIGMNRLRAAYVRLAPNVEHHLIASRFDDDDGVAHTYNYFRIPDISQILGSTGMLVTMVNAVIAGAFAGLAADGWGASTTVSVTAAVTVGLAYIAAVVALALRRYFGVRARYTALFPTSSHTDDQ